MAARLAISAALLAFLVTRVHLDTVLPRRPGTETLFWFCAGVAISILAIVLSAWRWQKVLEVLGVHVPLRTLTSHYFAGQFLGNVLPSTIGGDVLRVSRGGQSTGSMPVSFASVVLERLTGFVALPLLAFVGLALTPSLFPSRAGWLSLAIAVGALVVLAVLLAVAGSPKLAGRFVGHANWMRFIGAVHDSVIVVRNAPSHGFDLLGAAVIYQATTVAIVWCAVNTMNVDVPFTAVLAFAPVVAMAQVLPLSLSGLGVREGMLVILLGSLGVSAGRAVGVGLCWYAMTLIASVAGAPSFAVGSSRKRSQRAADDLSDGGSDRAVGER
jgi:uncharacterized membrane protein YbhN (UPF0104 family)